MKKLILIISLIFIVSCTSSLLNKEKYEIPDSSLDAINQNLDSQLDDFTDVLENGDTYVINSTYANNLKLCRVVTFRGNNVSHIETFCKVKGGSWK